MAHAMIRVAETDADIARYFDVTHRLRGKLFRDEFA